MRGNRAIKFPPYSVLDVRASESVLTGSGQAGAEQKPKQKQKKTVVTIFIGKILEKSGFLPCFIFVV